MKHLLKFSNFKPKFYCQQSSPLNNKIVDIIFHSIISSLKKFINPQKKTTTNHSNSTKFKFNPLLLLINFDFIKKKNKGLIFFGGMTGVFGLAYLMSNFIDPRSEFGKKLDSFIWDYTSTKVVDEKSQIIQPRELICYQFNQSDSIEEVNARFRVLEKNKLIFFGCNKLTDQDFQILQSYLDDDNNRLAFTRTLKLYNGPLSTTKYPNYQNFDLIVFNKERSHPIRYDLEIRKKLWDDKTITKIRLNPIEKV